MPFFPKSLATENENVRGRLVQYSNDILSLGVEGLRLDAAKRTLQLLPPPGEHANYDTSGTDMAAADVLNITKRLSPTPFITQEVSSLYLATSNFLYECGRFRSTRSYGVRMKTYNRMNTLSLVRLSSANCFVCVTYAIGSGDVQE